MAYKTSFSLDTFVDRPQFNANYCGEYRPSWATYTARDGGCYSRFCVQSDGALSLQVTEWYTSGNTQRTVSREGWMTLDVKTAKALLVFLNEHLKGAA